MISRCCFRDFVRHIFDFVRGMRRAWSQRSYSAADDGYRHAGRDLHHHSDGNGEYDYGDDVGDAYRGLKINSENVSRYLNGSAPRSTLPPERIIPTLRPSAPMRRFSAGAAATAPDGSTTIFIRSHNKRIAVTISSSLTSEISFTRRLRMAKVRGESDARSPSAIVSG